jgi:hypothetical protein
MTGKCWVCNRPARGFGHLDIRFKPGDPRSAPHDWVFCSRRCQAAFHALYGSWKDKGPLLEETFMVDPTAMEMAAMKACLRPFGEAAGEIGFDKPLGHYSEAEALAVVNAIVTTYQEVMSQAQARVNASVQGSSPFADLADDLPWETR